MKRLAVISAVFLVFAAALVTALAFMFSPSFLTAEVARAVIESSGKQINFGAHPRLTLWPEFGVVYRNVSLTESGAASKEPFADIAQMRVKISAAALIGRRVAIEEIRLVSPKIHLSVDESGRNNWSIAAPVRSGGGDKSMAEIPPIYVEGGRVAITDARSGQSFSFGRLDMVVMLASVAGPLDIKGSGDWQNDRVSFSLFVKSPQSLAGKGSPIDVNVSGSWLDFGFSGRGAVAEQLDLAGTVQGGSRSLRGLMRWAGVTIGEGKGLGNFRTSGALRVKGKTLELSKARFRLDGMTAAGEASLVLNEQKPALTARLDIDQLDLNHYFLVHTVGAREEGIERWSAAPVNFTLLQSIAAKAELRAERLIYGRATMSNAVIDAHLGNGILNAKVKQIDLYGGKGQGQLVLNGAQKVPTMQLGFDARGVDAQPLFRDLLNFDKLEGKSDCAIAIAATGHSPREMAASLRGSAGLQITNGRLREINVPMLFESVAQRIVLGWPESTDVASAFGLLQGNFKISDGIAESGDLELNGPELDLKGRGLIDILKGEVDIKVEAGAQSNGSITQLAVPLVISGPWDKPKLYPDIAGVLENPAAAYDALKALVGRMKEHTVGGQAEEAATTNNAGGVAGEALSSDAGPGEPARSVDLKKQLNTNTIELMNGFTGETPPEPVSSEQ